MDISRIDSGTGWFRVIISGETTQVAAMDLEPGGGESGSNGNEHPDSEQILYVLEGEIEAEIGNERAMLHTGDVVLVPREVPHRFTNCGTRTARTLNVYGPPAY